MDSYTSALRNLESRLAMALDAATQAEHDLNQIRLQAGLPPIKFFHLSAAIAEEPRVGPRGAVRLSAQDQDETVNMILDSASVARGQAVDMAAARKLRIARDK